MDAEEGVVTARREGAPPRARGVSLTEGEGGQGWLGAQSPTAIQAQLDAGRQVRAAPAERGSEIKRLDPGSHDSNVAAATASVLVLSSAF